MFIQRIVIDREFIDYVIEKAEPFIKLAILPELVGKRITKQNVTVNKDVIPQEPHQACDNDQCPIEWFHFSCLKITASQASRGKWYCPECHMSKKERENSMTKIF